MPLSAARKDGDKERSYEQELRVQGVTYLAQTAIVSGSSGINPSRAPPQAAGMRVHLPQRLPYHRPGHGLYPRVHDDRSDPPLMDVRHP